MLGEGVFTVFIDTEPAKAAEGAEDGCGGFAVVFAVAVFDGGGAAEAVVDLDADDGAVGFQIDPVAPGFVFVAWLEVLFFKGREHLGQGLGGGEFGDSNECFHGEGVVGNEAIFGSVNQFRDEV